MAIAVRSRTSHTHFMAAPTPRAAPFVIYRTVTGDGETYALEPRTRDRLRKEFGEQLRVHPRIFIAHETKADVAEVQTDLLKQVVHLLTGVTETRLAKKGKIEIRDAVTETLLKRVG